MGGAATKERQTRRDHTNTTTSVRRSANTVVDSRAFVEQRVKAAIPRNVRIPSPCNSSSISATESDEDSCTSSIEYDDAIQESILLHHSVQKKLRDFSPLLPLQVAAASSQFSHPTHRAATTTVASLTTAGAIVGSASSHSLAGSESGHVATTPNNDSRGGDSRGSHDSRRVFQAVALCSTESNKFNTTVCHNASAGPTLGNNGSGVSLGSSSGGAEAVRRRAQRPGTPSHPTSFCSASNTSSASVSDNTRRVDKSASSPLCPGVAQQQLQRKGLLLQADTKDTVPTQGNKKKVSTDDDPEPQSNVEYWLHHSAQQHDSTTDMASSFTGKL